MLTREKLEAWRLGRKIMRERRKIKFIGYLKLTGRKVVYERVDNGDSSTH